MILKELIKYGYQWDYRVLNSANFGDPQTRKR
ncbi:MAG: DNA cytosine methyltransferase, partial [Fusobacterium sp.]